eukprot:CAMPEP_0171319426 /NCGR_PEP_ID=MMETSP0816-20121228/96479_1 /TAXON_ID=420281 /ORGANISM="Proboscia inermis, Strain CCAP1064/1" /LENGTH=76 /DNA_ID=CAMNT_0011815093 /DNA_START=12 /DNA_END=239 /DNA_ORIENTATION=-
MVEIDFKSFSTVSDTFRFQLSLALNFLFPDQLRLLVHLCLTSQFLPTNPLRLLAFPFLAPARMICQRCIDLIKFGG